jgi:hypothetical protein
LFSSPKQFGGDAAALVATIAVVFAVCGKAQSQNTGEEDTRGVRIIGTPPSPPGADNSSPVPHPSGTQTAPTPLLTPALPSPTPPAVPATTPQPIGGDKTPAPSFLTPALVPPPSSVPAPDVPAASRPASNNLATSPNKPESGAYPTQQNPAMLSSGTKLPNTAGLSMQILPGADIAVGTEVSFQVSSQKAGYLILIDVDASGKLIQIYPNPMSLLAPGGVRENSNYLRHGKALQIPDRQNPYSGFELIASPPAGTAMVVALLSDRPVQLVDLPDVPSALLGSASMADYLTKIANELRIPNRTGNDQLQEAHWSFDVKFYVIR